MPLPTIKTKQRVEQPTNPKKKKYGLQPGTADAIYDCNNKAVRIRQHLKGTYEQLEYDLEADIERAINTVVSKHQKALDLMIADRGIDTSDKRSQPPPAKPEQQRPLFQQ